MGTEVRLRHRRPSAVGAAVRVSARLTDVDGSSLLFSVEAHEAGRLVAEGTVRRAVVAREPFVARATGDGNRG